MPGTGRDSAGPAVPPEQVVEDASPRLETPGGQAYDPTDVVEELVDTAEQLIGDRAAAWEAILTEVRQRLARRDEWGPPDGDEGARGRASRTRTAGRSGGAMPTHPDLLQAAPRRRFSGFDRERATYARLVTELLARAEGKFVAIVGDDVVGPLDSHGEAERAGYATFGLGPLYIKQILAAGPAVEVTRLVVP